MNVKRIFGLALVVCALAVTLPVSAAAADSKADDLSVYFRPAVRFGTDDRTLFILDFLVPVYRGNKDLLFINTKFTPDNREAWETNLGVGYRRMLSDKLVLGGNLFYDHRKTKYGSHFDQLGLGFEAMADVNGLGLATRFNYYQPLTKAKLGDDFGYSFYGNGIYTAGIEEPMTGFDYEAGIRIPGISDYVETWAYAGGYHFFGCHTPDVNGVSARLEAIPTDFLRIGFEFRNDNVNGDEYFGEIAFEIPFSIDNLVAGKNPFEGIGDVLTGSRSLKERMVEPVHRDVDIVVGKDYLSGPEAASGDGSLAAGVIFVADNADSGGDGSFEHPYDNLMSATGDGRLGDTISIVHVLTGGGTGLAGESFGQDGITIWGAGAVNPAYPYVTNFVSGYPLIMSALYLNGADMTMLGLSIEASEYAAVSVGGYAFESGLSIFANTIYNEGYYGIWFDGPDGIGTADTPVSIWGNKISVEGVGGNAVGICLESYDSDIYAQVHNNRIEEIWSDDLSAGIRINAGGGSFYGDISGNTISDVEGYDAFGIRVDTDTDFNGTISWNTIFDIDGEDNAMGIDPDCGGDFNGAIADNNLSDIGTYGNYASGIDVDADNFNGVITRNTISGIFADNYAYAYAYGIFVDADDELNGSITDNTIYDIYSSTGGDEGEAYGIYAIADDDFDCSISGNTIGLIEAYGGYYNLAAGIYAISDDDNITGTITRNTISSVWAGGAGEAVAAGIYVEAEDENITGSINDNAISDIWAGDAEDASAYGIYAEAEDDYYGFITGNRVSGVWAENGYSSSEAYGIYAEAEDNFYGLISGNTISDISGDPTRDYGYASGIYAYVDGDFTGSITENSISNIRAYYWPDGIAIEGYGVFNGTISNNTIAGVTDYDGFADGIWIGNFYTIAGSISGNTMTGISSPGSAAGIYFADWYNSVQEITTSITGNYIAVTGGLEAYGLYAEALGGTLGTALSPLVFTGNSGRLNGTTIFMAYLTTSDPGASNVWIGYHANPNMKNDFTGTGAWGGNYPHAGGPIWANDNGSFINR